MSEMQQGSQYEEEDYGFEEEEEYEDEEADLEIDTFYGIPKNTIILGAAALVVLIIAVGIVMTWRSKSKDEEPVYDEMDNDFLDTDDYEISIDDYEEDLDEFTVDESYSEPVNITVADLTSEQSDTLRKLGWSGDEIDIALSYGLNYQALVDYATELRDEEAKEALQRMSDTAGPEFKEIMNYTFMGQGEVQNPSGDRDQYEESRTSVKINADYIKCPTRGNQLWLKCRIATDAYVWYQCSPIRWLTLPDEGNIVLNVDFWLLNDTAYVTNISEADSTLNSIDSSHSYEEVTQEDEVESSVDENEGAAFLTN